jgi:peptidoglycan/xylan/chitin deacetylase (PgdA/CDA1 family)
VQRAFPWARITFVAAIAVAWWNPLLAAALLAISVGAGVFWQRAGLFARPILGVEPARAGDRLALTFDDGPHPVHTRTVLDLLEARGHRATFFVIGKKAEASPELLAEITRRGHALGNHSYSHAHTIPFFSVAKLTQDLERAQSLLGRPPRWFRAPAGVLSPRVVAAAERAKLTLVGWTATARDGIAGTTVEQAVARLEPSLRPGAILTLHDAAERDGRAPIAPEVLARVLDALERRRLRSVTLDELLSGE